MIIILSNSCTLNIISESMDDKVSLVSSRIEGFTPLVGDNEIGVLSFDDSDGADADDREVNFTPRVMSP